MTRSRTNFTPAMLAAALLHLLVLAAGVIVWPWTAAPPVSAGVTTVTIVDAPAAQLRPAVQAQEVTPSASEEPVAEAPPEAPAPTPAPAAPAPAPPPSPAPAPKPAPTPTPAKPAPAPSPTPTPKPPPKAAAKPATSGLDLDALTTSLTKSAKAGAAKSSAPKGPSRPETALAARDGKGQADAALADAGAAVGARLMRMWNPNCSVEGAGDIIIRVRFNLTPEGQLAGAPQLLDQGSGPVWQTAADRAVRAVAQAAPYTELPRQTYGQWKTFTARFNGEQACR